MDVDARFSSRVYAFWMRIVHILGTFNAYLLFSILYIFVVGLYAILFRIVGVFQGRMRARTAIGWQEKTFTEPTIENLRRLF